MWAFAIDEMRERRRPVLHELMFECDCEVLKTLSVLYPPSRHGFSTTVMASFFRPEYLESELSDVELARLCLHIFFGRPVFRSAYDGLPGFET